MQLITFLTLLGLAQMAAAKHDKSVTHDRHEIREQLDEKFKTRGVHTPLAERLQGKFGANRVARNMIHKENAKLEHRRDLVKGRRVGRNLQHEVVFAVKQNNIDEIKRILHDVSNPHSSNFGKHMTKAEVTAMTHNVQSNRHVIAFLEAHGARITKDAHGSDYITAEAPVHVWEAMFSTEFHEYRHVKTGRSVVRAESYSLPDTLVEHVTAAFNTVQFPDERVLGAPKKPHVRKPKKDLVRKHSAGKETENTVIIDGYVTPDFLNEYYHITSNTGNHLGSQCVYETINQTYSPSDLTYFQEWYNVPVEAVSVDIGGHAANDACATDDGDNCGEANLDVQYLMAVSQVTPTTYYYWNGTDFMLDFVTTIANMADPPKVISVSYSSYEAYYSDSYLETFDTEAMKLGVIGVTLLSAAGDDGVAGYLARGDSAYCGYWPQFPATSPYVTAVGGTMGPETGSTEIACQSNHDGVITTGGGFSDHYAAPDWQKDFISTYFQRATAPYSGYSTGGRGYPDVSSLAANYLVVMNATTQVLYGTSASTPVIAGFVSLVNAHRLAAGKSTLGWINPSLYSFYGQFAIDITSGENNCAADGYPCCNQGFYAATGWDPLTGLGSVNYTGFYTAMFALGDYPNEPTLQPTPAFTAPTYNPTAEPTRDPTTSAHPTYAPTTPNYLAAGWAYVNTYSDSYCSGQTTEVFAYPTNQCFVTYNSANAVTGSLMYQCTDTATYVSTFSDSSCMDLVMSNSYDLMCDNVINDYFSTNQYSTDLKCVAGSGRPLPVYPSATYATQNYYDSGASYTCDPSVLSGFDSMLENYCFSYQDFSYMITFPTVNVYYDSYCASLEYTYVLPGECTSTFSYYGYYGAETNADKKKTVNHGVEKHVADRKKAHAKKAHSKKAHAQKAHSEKSVDQKKLKKVAAAKKHLAAKKSSDNKEVASNNYFDDDFFFSYFDDDFFFSNNNNYFDDDFDFSWDDDFFFSNDYSSSYYYPYFVETSSMSMWVQDHAGPSAAPTAAPSGPSGAPSVAPTKSAPQVGWLYGNLYYDGYVDSNIIAVEGQVTNKCIQIHYGDYYSGSIMYGCSTINGTYSYSYWINDDCAGQPYYSDTYSLYGSFDDDYYFNYLAETEQPSSGYSFYYYYWHNHNYFNNYNYYWDDDFFFSNDYSWDDDFFFSNDYSWDDDFFFSNDYSWDDDFFFSNDYYYHYYNNFHYDDDFFRLDYSYSNFQCVMNQGIPTPRGIPFATNLTYSTEDDCGGNSPLSFTSFKQNTCLPVKNGQSLKYSLPEIYTYNGTECATLVSTAVEVVGTCEITDVSPFTRRLSEESSKVKHSAVAPVPEIKFKLHQTIDAQIVKSLSKLGTHDDRLNALRKHKMESLIPAKKHQQKRPRPQKKAGAVAASPAKKSVEAVKPVHKKMNLRHQKDAAHKESAAASVAVPAPVEKSDKKHMKKHADKATMKKHAKKPDNKKHSKGQDVASNYNFYYNHPYYFENHNYFYNYNFYNLYDDDFFFSNDYSWDDDFFFSNDYSWDDDFFFSNNYNDDFFSWDDNYYYTYLEYSTYSKWEVTNNGAPTMSPTERPTYKATNIPTPLPGSPTRVPTTMPSRKPTMTPTVAQTYMFTAVQNLIGVSASSYVSQKTQNDNAMKDAVAACMPGIYSTDITITSVTDAAARRLMSAESASDVSNVGYTVNYNLAALGYYGDPQSAYNALVTSLNTNIANGNFNLYINSAARNYGSTTMTSVTSTSVTESAYSETNPTTTDSTDDNSSNDDNSNVGAIAGSIVGVVLFLAICVAVYMYFRKNTSRDSDAVKSDSVGAPAVNAMFSNPMSAPAAVAEPVQSSSASKGPLGKSKGEDENAGAVELSDRSGAAEKAELGSSA